MIDVIICAKNNKDIISKCLDSIFSQDFRDVNVILVDDGSTDGMVEYVGREYPKVKVVFGGKGPAENRNIAVRESSGEHIVFLDSDVVLKSGFFSSMVEFIEKRSSCGIVCARLLLDDDTICGIGGVMTKIAGGYDFGFEEKATEYLDSGSVQVVCSAAIMVRRSVFDKLGGFDGDYFYNYEDTDLSLRANIAGYGVLYNPNAIAYHARHVTVDKGFGFSKKKYLRERNMLLTYLKNYEVGTLVKYFFPFFGLVCYKLVFKGNRLSVLKGYFWNLKNFKRIMGKRREVNKLRKVSDKEIFSRFKVPFI